MKILLAAAFFLGSLVIALGSPTRAAAGTSPHDASSNMTYHGGWVMRTNTTFTIFWLPAGSTCGASDPTCDTYISGVDRYFKDVAAASGSHNNVYSVDTEYSDTTGLIAYQSTFGGAFIDEHPFPAYDPNTSCTDGTYPVCLTDQQIQAEVQQDVTELGWPDGESVLFNVMTPDSVSECDDHTSTFCLGSFCAYHGAFTGSDAQPIVYTLEPFAETDGCAGIPLNPSPNGDDADPTDNLISHEMNEAITDPWGTGWYTGPTTNHGEIADLRVELRQPSRHCSERTGVQRGHQRAPVLPAAGVEQRRQPLRAALRPRSRPADERHRAQRQRSGRGGPTALDLEWHLDGNSDDLLVPLGAVPAG